MKISNQGAVRGKLIRIGVDTSKSVFQLHGVSEDEQPALKKKLRRSEVLTFFCALPPTQIGMEACGAAYHWAREIKRLGHDVVLIPPQYVKPYVDRGKNDAADAAAICEAMSRPKVQKRFVPVKAAEQQAGQMLMGLRDQLVRRRTQLSNTIRGYAAEFGCVAAKGLAHIEPLLARLAQDESLPALAKELFAMLGAELRGIAAEIGTLDLRLMAIHRGNEMSRRLAEIPSVGPVGACLLALKAPDPSAFRVAATSPPLSGLHPKTIPPPARSDRAASPAPAMKRCARPLWSAQPR